MMSGKKYATATDSTHTTLVVQEVDFAPLCELHLILLFHSRESYIIQTGLLSSSFHSVNLQYRLFHNCSVSLSPLNCCFITSLRPLNPIPLMHEPQYKILGVTSCCLARLHHLLGQQDPKQSHDYWYAHHIHKLARVEFKVMNTIKATGY